MSQTFRRGDRVRIIHPTSEYTGCRGTIADPPTAGGPGESADGVTRLGHHVAIDGENGILRPFLVSDLQPLQAVRAGRTRRAGSQAKTKAPASIAPHERR